MCCVWLVTYYKRQMIVEELIGEEKRWYEKERDEIIGEE